MNALLREGQLEPIDVIADRITGHRPSRQSMWRWRTEGTAGEIKLACVPVAGGWKTTEAAFLDFLSRRADYANRPPAERRATAEFPDDASDSTLKEAGLL